MNIYRIFSEPIPQGLQCRMVDVGKDKWEMGVSGR